VREGHEQRVVELIGERAQGPRPLEAREDQRVAAGPEGVVDGDVGAQRAQVRGARRVGHVLARGDHAPAQPHDHREKEALVEQPERLAGQARSGRLGEPARAEGGEGYDGRPQGGLAQRGPEGDPPACEERDQQEHPEVAEQHEEQREQGRTRLGQQARDGAGGDGIEQRLDGEDEGPRVDEASGRRGDAAASGAPAPETERQPERGQREQRPESLKLALVEGAGAAERHAPRPSRRSTRAKSWRRSRSGLAQPVAMQ